MGKGENGAQIITGSLTLQRQTGAENQLGGEKEAEGGIFR